MSSFVKISFKEAYDTYQKLKNNNTSAKIDHKETNKHYSEIVSVLTDYGLTIHGKPEIEIKRISSQHYINNVFN